MMEFGPEVAVLQSTFQLVQNKAGKNLAGLLKTECAEYVHILKRTLEEICQGLEHDLDAEEQFLWQKNMHTLILYSLIKKVYKVAEKKDGMPVYSPMDVLVQVVPKFSCHLYFELVKECSWEQLLINSLSYLEPAIAAQLLQDLMGHCTQEPIAIGDCKIIGTCRETVLVKLLSVPVEFDSILDKQLLKPLSRPDKFIPLIKENLDDLDSIDEPKLAAEGMGHDELALQQRETEDRLAQNTEASSLQSNQIDQPGAEAEQFKADQYVDVEVVKQTGSLTDENSDKIINIRALEETNNDRLLWTNILCQNSSFLEELLIFTENHLDKIQVYSDSICCLAQLALLGCLKTEKISKVSYTTEEKKSIQRTDVSNQWLVFNLFHRDIQSRLFAVMEGMSEFIPAYIVDLKLANLLIERLPTEKWLKCVNKVLKKITEKIQGSEQRSSAILTQCNNIHDTSRVKVNTEERTMAATAIDDTDIDYSGNFVHIASDLCLYKTMLFRMMQGCFTDIKKTLEGDSDKLLKECEIMLVDLQDAICSGKAEPEENIKMVKEATPVEIDSSNALREGTISNVDSHAVKKDLHIPMGFRKMGIKLGDSWRSDVTLEALCWRIKFRLPFCQECVDELLYPECLEFWSDERVYDAFTGNIQLLSVKDRVIKLTEILKSLKPETKEVTLKAQQLTFAAFTGLSFLNQDTVATEIYMKDEVMEDYLGLKDVQVMTVFNRITALRDDQILSELFLLCLSDPRTVISSAVKMCVSNKEQAKNFAQVLQFFPNICQAVHPTHHPDSTLLGHMIKEFLLTTRLTDKEQSAFIVFLTTLLEESSSQRKISLLSPLELMEQSILPFIDVQTLHNNGPITSKFALTMLKAVIETGCNKSYDWSKFQPLGMFLCFGELLQECVAFWDGEGELDGQTKIVVKTLVHECLMLMNDKLFDEVIVPETEGEFSDECFQHCLTELDFHVVLRLQEMFGFLDMNEHSPDYQEALDQLLEQPDTHLASILVISSFSIYQQLLTDLTEAIQRTRRSIVYDEIIAAMIQVVPNLLNWEFERMVKYVKSSIDKDLLLIPYRMGNTLHIPLTVMKGCESILGISQLLRDVIITLSFLSDRTDMLHHVIQCYTACLKSLTSTITSSQPEVTTVFIISQVFHHVCDIVQLLPLQTTEPALVLLLHLLSSYTDILDNSPGARNHQKWRERMTDNITCEIQTSVNRFPDSMVEKEMLMKKIMKVMH